MANKPLDDLLQSKKRLDEALDATILAWPKVSPCWIDIINEPTVELEESKLVPRKLLGDRP